MHFIPITTAASLLLATAACNRNASQPAAAKPAAALVAHEANLLTLSAETQQRLALVTTTVHPGKLARVRHTSGEVVAAPLGAAGIPIDAGRNLATLGSQQTAADGEVARAQAVTALARIAAGRSEALLDDGAGSARARDEAAAALAAAQAAEQAALAQRALLGPAIGAINSRSTIWIRVPIFATDAQRILRERTAEVRTLDASGPARLARPIAATPSASFVAGTVDAYYAVDNRDQAYQLGQRVAVQLPLAGLDSGLLLPVSAIVRDIDGGEWVYRAIASGQYRRARIEVAHRDAGQALLSRGLSDGDEVVSTGAAELFGSEFGAGH
ncbi:hypothetical protein [uncultured Nevskia sp.]|uniref:efflux RND transporter periplasmic adaptor subunit n=1 Tax=uncultured Nevskia sp. TaxID=228950 RepID=UPI0025F71C71|nr:hypothetical protein [uncultured Nevskia sp.]